MKTKEEKQALKAVKLRARMMVDKRQSGHITTCGKEPCKFPYCMC